VSGFDCPVLVFYLQHFHSWVDRDMFMRYCGGGPGHHGVPTCALAWKLHPNLLPQQSNCNAAPPVEDDASSESESEDDASDFEPDALDLLVDELMEKL